MRRVLALALVVFVATPALAVPTSLTHQGRLFDSNGISLDGALPVVVSLWDAETGGTELWTESMSVDFADGYFAVTLGESAPVTAAELESGAVWFDMTVDGNASGARMPMTSVPYAILAGGVRGGVVDASEIRINGTTVIDDTGALIGGLPSDVLDGDADTLGTLACANGDFAVFDGLDWDCGVPAAHTHDAGDVVSGAFDIARLPVGTSATDVAAGDHLHALSQLTGVITSSQLPTDMGTIVDGYVVDGALDLAGGSTMGGAAISTGGHFTAGDAVSAMGGLGNGNALNHDRYDDTEAVAAMGSVGNGNALNHDRYGDAEAVAAMGAVGNGNALNHDRYGDAEAVAAMGGIANGNPLHHNRFTNANARAAVGFSGSESSSWAAGSGRSTIEIGNTRIVSGRTACAAAGTGSISYGSTFTQRPSVTVTHARAGGSSDDNLVGVYSLGTTGFSYLVMDKNSAGVTAENCSGEYLNWVAIGPF